MPLPFNASESITVPATVLPPAESLFLTGATASGKTTLAIELAERLGAEVISMDSMAIYRGMDIGTAKPSAEDRRRIRHHLVDIVDAWEDFSLAEYLNGVSDATRQIVARARVPLFVGGTPLYLKALLHGVDSGSPPNAALRSQLDRQATALGSQSLHDRLALIDPAAAKRIHPNDVRRIVRALEVFEDTGVPISTRQIHFHEPTQSAARVLCLDLPRPELYSRINERVKSMFQKGLVAEVRSLMELPRPLSRTACQAVGYKEVIAHLAGTRSLADTIELVQRRSRQFAKRQLTWFRGFRNCRCVPVGRDFDVKSIADTILAEIDALHTTPAGFAQKRAPKNGL
jgi:tRNA dimethylallyltransferase